MKTKVISIILIIAASIIGFNYGLSKGRENGLDEASIITATQSIESLKEQLKQREISEIITLVHGKAGIIKRDEGGLFSVKYIYYFEGVLSNDAAVAKANDIKINIDFISKTGSKIDSREITIYDFINPGKELGFKEKIQVPENFDEIEFSIIGAIGG